jgi:cell division transport system permease protein
LAILTFLAGLAAAGAELVAASSREWQGAIAREATIQLRGQSGRDIELDLARAAEIARKVPGIADARPLGRAEAEALLEPWLGRGLDLSSLPVPRLVVLRLAEEPRPDLGTLRRRLAAELPGASLDDHGAWRARLSGVATTLLGVATVLVFLVVAASALAVAFATRGAMAGSRESVDVLQLVGADDRFIVREFAARFLKLSLVAAAVGALAAALSVFVLAHLLGPGTGSSGGRDPALLDAAAVGLRGYGLIGLVAGSVVAVAGFVSVATAKRFLRELRAR